LGLFYSFLALFLPFGLLFLPFGLLKTIFRAVLFFFKSFGYPSKEEKAQKWVLGPRRLKKVLKMDRKGKDFNFMRIIKIHYI